MMYALAFIVSLVIDGLMALWVSWFFNMPFLLSFLLLCELSRRVTATIALKRQRESEEAFAQLLDIARENEKHNKNT